MEASFERTPEKPFSKPAWPSCSLLWSGKPRKLICRTGPNRTAAVGRFLSLGQGYGIDAFREDEKKFLISAGAGAAKARHLVPFFYLGGSGT